MSENALSLRTLCVLMLAVEWLFFGPCHFLFPNATEAQIPDYISLKYTIVIVTGVAEVVTGLLILIPRIGKWESRKWAAMFSLALLFLYLPAVFHILVNDEAIRGPVVWRFLFRVILVPNNILLVLCAFYLLRYKDG